MQETKDSSNMRVSAPDFVVLDTCVLISNILRKLFLRLGQHGCLGPVWGDYIGVEWRRNASRIWEVDEFELDEQWQFMQKQFPQANMGAVHQYESALTRSDPKDRHVIACGIACLQQHPDSQAAIVTWNTKDFNRRELRENGLQLYTPDQVLKLIWHDHAQLLCDLFELFASDCREIEKPFVSITETLKRERLFMINKLYVSQLEAAGAVDKTLS